MFYSPSFLLLLDFLFMNKKQLLAIIIAIIKIIIKSDAVPLQISNANIKHSPYIILLIVLLIILKFLLVVLTLFLSISIELTRQAIHIRLKISEIIIIVVICVSPFLINIIKYYFIYCYKNVK